jgi:hypothetical protein
MRKILRIWQSSLIGPKSVVHHHSIVVRSLPGLSALAVQMNLHHDNDKKQKIYLFLIEAANKNAYMVSD